MTRSFYHVDVTWIFHSARAIPVISMIYQKKERKEKTTTTTTTTSLCGIEEF